MLAAGREIVQQAMGALEPAIGDRRLGADAQVVPGQPDCDPGRRARIVTLPVERIGPLTGGESSIQVVLPPGGQRQALPGRRRLLVDQRSLEPGARRRPITTLQRRVAFFQRALRIESRVADVPVTGPRCSPVGLESQHVTRPLPCPMPWSWPYCSRFAGSWLRVGPVTKL
jgi:hypothetical protein